LADNQLPDITVHMMAQFVGQHNLYLVRSVTIEHCVAQHNPAGIA